MKILIFVLLAILFLFGCASDPKDKSSLNIFSGDHYEADANVFGMVPIGHRSRKKESVIRGKALVIKKGLEYPLRFKEILLFKEEVSILSSTTDHLGRFSLKGRLDNGEYIIKINEKSYKIQKKIKLNGYKLNGVILKVVESNESPA